MFDHCVCGSVLDHAMTCSRGGITITRHNDITANWLSEVCRNAEREPPLLRTLFPFLQVDVKMQEQVSGDISNVHSLILGYSKLHSNACAPRVNFA